MGRGGGGGGAVYDGGDTKKSFGRILRISSPDFEWIQTVIKGIQDTSRLIVCKTETNAFMQKESI